MVPLNNFPTYMQQTGRVSIMADGMAFKNYSMLEDNEMSVIERLKRKFGLETLDSPRMFAPLGHVYSVMVEVLGIEEPDLRGFIDDINNLMGEYNKSSHVKHPAASTYHYTALKIKDYLCDQVRIGRMEKSQAKRIMEEAIGGFDWDSWAFIFSEECTYPLP
jgi:hypothetical protein